LPTLWQCKEKSAADPDVLGEPYYAETLDLALHGFADYFFQTLAADYWVDRGYDLFALDLRKCGRSIRPHQTPNLITDLASYFEEIDAAMRRVRDRDGHPHVVLTAHSTGGPVARCGRTRAGLLSRGWCSTPHGSTCVAVSCCAPSAPASSTGPGLVGRT